MGGDMTEVGPLMGSPWGADSVRMELSPCFGDWDLPAHTELDNRAEGTPRAGVPSLTAGWAFGNSRRRWRGLRPPAFATMSAGSSL